MYENYLYVYLYSNPLFRAIIRKYSSHDTSSRNFISKWNFFRNFSIPIFLQNHENYMTRKINSPWSSKLLKEPNDKMFLSKVLKDVYVLIKLATFD